MKESLNDLRHCLNKPVNKKQSKKNPLKRKIDQGIKKKKPKVQLIRPPLSECSTSDEDVPASIQIWMKRVAGMSLKEMLDFDTRQEEDT